MARDEAGVDIFRWWQAPDATDASGVISGIEPFAHRDEPGRADQHRRCSQRLPWTLD
jgi:hypothetical protein